jgi:hypothetical protein
VNAVKHNDKLLVAMLSSIAANRSHTVGAILHAARNASSLNALRTEMDRLIEIMMTVDALHEEQYKLKEARHGH